MAIIDKIQLSGTVYTIGNETTTAVTSASTDNEIPTAKAVYDAIPQGGSGGGSITIDQSLDSSSTNAVANSVITNAINDRQLKREYVGSEKVFTSEDTRVINGKRVYIIHPVFRCYSNNDTNTELVLNNKDLGLYFPKINGKNIFSTNINDVNFLTEVLEPSAITTSVSSESTDTQVPSAKAVYDIVGNIETLLSKI